MRLHSPQVQRQLRRAVQTALHASPKLAAEARRQRKKARSQGNADYAVMRLFGTAWLVVMLFMGPLPYQLTALALWGLASVLTGGTRLASLLEGDQERQPLLHLPVADNLVCHRQGWKFLWLSLWLWADGLAGYGLLWWGAGSSRAPHWVWVPVLATLHWALVLALSVVAAQRPWLGRHGIWALLALWACFVAVCIPSTSIGPWLTARFAEGSDWVTLVLPTGWPACLFSRALLGGQWSTLILLAPAGVVIWMGLNAWKQLRARFLLQDLDSINPDPDAPPDLASWRSPHESLGPTALVDSIGNREFLQPQSVWCADDWLERLAARWSTPREQLLAEVAMEANRNWSPAWRKALIILGLGNLIAWAWQQSGSKYFGWLDGLVLVVVAGMTLPTQLSAAPEVIGILPVRLAEILRLRTKLWIIRSASATPLFALGALCLAWRLNWPLWNTLAIALKGALLSHALFPYASLLGIGQGEQRTGRLRSVGYGLLLLVCAGSTLLFAFAALAPELLDSRSSWLAWLCLPLAVLPGWGFVAAYVRRFNRGGVDLDSGNDLDLE